MEQFKNIRYLGYIFLVFLFLRQTLGFIADTMAVRQAWDDMGPLLASVPMLVWEVVLVGVAIIIVFFLVRIYESRKKRALPPVHVPMIPNSKFQMQEKLVIRFAENRQEIIELEKTEDYGDAGSTNLEQAIGWFNCYKQGNILAVYEGKVVGGMDIWPIQKRIFDDMKSGRIGEEQLRGDDMVGNNPSRKASYWYLASISLGMVWRGARFRYELLARLIIHATELWGSSVQVFPAHVMALGWTDEGRNLLFHFGFSKVDKSNSAFCQDEAFCRTFNSPGEVEALIAHLVERLENRASQ